MKSLFLLLLILFPSFIFSQSWQDVGGGTNNSSHGMLTWDNKLVDLGSFNNPCKRVALWDGSNWECLGNGVGIVARAGTVWNGNLVVVGDFWNVFQPCTNCNGIAMWDGAQWTNIGAGFNNDVLCVTVWNGDLVAAGDFTQSNGQPCSRIARWTGTEWQQIGPDNAFNNDIRAITEFENELWVGGDFSNVGGCTSCDGLIKWNGSAWVGGNSGVDLSGGVDTTVRVLYTSPTDGKLYMGGHFRGLTPNGVWNPDLNGVAMYDGSDWFALGQGVGDSDEDYVRAISEYNGSIVVGGYYTTASGLSANKIARFNLTTETWSAMGQGFDGIGVDEYVKASAVWNGILFAGGAYTQAEGGPMNYIAQWYEPPIVEPLAVINNEQTTMCSGGCFNFTDNSTYSPTSWNWSFPGGSITSSTAQNPPPICYATPGTYTVTLQACNSFGCDTDTKTITVTSGPTLSVNNPTICNGSSVLITANPSITGGSFLWSPGGQTTSAITVSPTINTNYSVTYTSPTCGSASATSTVTLTSTPTVSVTNSTICSGGTATITATPSVGGGDFEWSPGGQTTQTINVSPTSSETYTVIYTVGDCSSLPATSTVTVSPAPTVSVNSTTICQGNSTTLTATPSASGGTYLWSPGGQTTPSITVSPTSTTTYSVVYTLNGCPSTSATGTVTVTTTPSATVNSTSICSGGSATLNATPSAGGGTYLWSPGGQTTSSITVSPTSNTTYSVVYTLNSCPSSSSSGTVSVNQTPTATVNNQTICSGNSTTLTATPSTGGGTYLWSPGGQTTSSISVNPTSTTTYSVVYSLNGCPSSSATGIVTVNTTPTVTVNSQSICSGGSATLTATPSTGGGTYLWSPGGQTTSSITVNPTSTTTYSVVYTLNSCPSSSASGIVTVTAPPTVSVANTTICSGGQATLVATPSVAGGTYLWAPGGETTSSIVVSPSSLTTYSVQYMLTGCSIANGSGTVSVNQTPTVTVNNQTICSGNSTTLTATPSTGGGTYLWSPGGQTTASIVVNPTLTATYSVVYTLNNCSSSPATGIVSVNTTPTVTVNSQSICSGGSATLITTPSVGGGTYLWSPGGQTTSSITVSPTSPTTYSVVYTLNSCPSTPALGTVNVTNTPTLTVNNTSICSGNNATLNAAPSTGGGTFIWSPNGETSQAIIVSPSSTTTYSVIYTLNGCSSTATSGTVSVTTSPTVTVNSNSICSGQSATLNAVPSTGGGTFLWSPNGETSQSIIVSPTNNSNYSVIYTLNSCPSNSAMATVSVTTTPTVSVNSTSICDGGMATLTANPSNSGGTYLWSPNGETSSTINVSPTVNSSYTVVYSLNGCSSSLATGYVTVTSVPSVTVNSTTICSGQTATLSASPSAIGGTYLWSPSGETSETIVVTPMNNQTYSVEYTLNGCPVATGFGTVAVNQTPTLIVNNESICVGNDAVLTAEPSILGGTFEWSPNGETSQSIVVNPTINASYSVTYELNGCSSDVAVSTVEVLPIPDLTLDVLSTSISAVQTNADYQWLDCNDNMNAISGEINQVFTPTIDGTYAVEITLDGCTGISECQIFETGGLIENNPTMISVYPNPFNDVLNIKVSDQLIGTTLSLVNSIGQWIQDIPITKIEFDLNLNSLETGMYYLTSSQLSTLHQKLVKF